jgi:hypothetical protein
MNPLKARYHFIDLLKPEDKLVALLLTTFEPALKRDLPLLFRTASAYGAQVYRQAVWKVAGKGHSPGQPKLVARSDHRDVPAEVSQAFADELKITSAQQTVGVNARLRRLFVGDESTNFRARLEKGESVDLDRLRKLQIALRARMNGDKAFDRRDSSNEYAFAARDMIDAGVASVVVMGHTHLERDVAFAGGGRYLNTGTWADRIRVDDAILADSEEGRAALMEWLRRLVLDELNPIRFCSPTYADVRVSDDGRVIEDGSPMLRRHEAGVRFS